MWEYNYSTQLCHHGILGMRWGVRRYQNKNGSLTNTGKKRYQENSDDIQKSNHRLKLEQKYIKKGMSQKQAEFAAERRLKTEKIVAITAGITVAAATAYVINKNIKERADKIIKSGKSLQRVEMKQTNDIFDTLYAAKNKGDKTKYAGLLGQQRKQQTGHAYIMQLAAKKDIKVASRKNAEKVFSDLYSKDSEFRAKVQEYAQKNVKGKNFAKNSMKKMYENFNSNLVYLHENDAAKKFYGELKSKGYGAIQDINDMKFSGYKAKNPLIIFGAKESLMVKTVHEMTGNEVNKNLLKTGAKETAKQLSIFGGLGIGLTKIADNSNNTSIINEYRIAHPNTNLTDKEIINSYYK